MDRAILNRLLGSAIVALVLTLSVAGLQFYGVINMTLGRICFIGVFSVGCGGIVFSEWLWKQEVRTKVFAGMLGILLWAFVIWRMDEWARTHGPQAAVLNPTPTVSDTTKISKPGLSKQADPRFLLGKDVEKLAADILRDEIVRVELERDWWKEHDTYREKFVGSDNQFDIAFATRTEAVFSRLEADREDTSKARRQFKNHEVLLLGFELEKIARKVLGTKERSLSAEDQQFLVDRFGLNSGGFHNPQTKINVDSAMFVYADPECKECTRFAEQIRRCAELAKWKVNPRVEPSPYSMRSIPGITVRGSLDGLGGEPGEWLNRMGFNATNDGHTDVPENPMEVHLFVGR
jgi:hypothetical protein